MKKIVSLLFSVCFLSGMFAQTLPCDCPYPVLFLHGWISNSETWTMLDNTFVKNVWGPRADVFHAAPNAKTTTKLVGADNVYGTADDDVQWVFSNENNVLLPGCMYAINFDVAVSNGALSTYPLVGGSPSAFDADNNESAIMKQGAMVGRAIQAVLAANPTKKKVILVGHSMGGLAAREYLQRTVNNNATSAKRWWVNPSQADGHKVAKLLTVGTPHRGSNTMGNISNLRPANDSKDLSPTSTARTNQNAVSPTLPNPTVNNSLPDLASEAVRDLRYSYDNWNPFGNDYSGVYLFGGKESDIPTLPYSYWNNDVNCDGTVNNTTQIGINQSGKSVGKPYEWDGTRDNPSMPLPTNVRYTYYISNTLSGGTLTGGDLVVDDQRQWLFMNGTGSGSTSAAGIPYPHDGTNYRLSDRILLEGGPMHTSETNDAANVMRGLDEGDYPKFAHDVNTGVWYAGMAQVRATEVVETPNTTDPDWFKFTLTSSNKVTIQLYTTPNLTGRVDLYTTAPNQYATLTANGNVSQTFTAANTAMISVGTATNLAAGTYYVRVRHNAATANSWQTPYRFRIALGNNLREATEVSQSEMQTPEVLVFGAYPNPMKGEGKAHFQLMNTQEVKLSLKNMMGQEVMNLYKGTAQSEELVELPFQTHTLPKGIYFLTLESDKVHQVEKIVVE